MALDRAKQKSTQCICAAPRRAPQTTSTVRGDASGRPARPEAFSLEELSEPLKTLSVAHALDHTNHEQTPQAARPIDPCSRHVHRSCDCGGQGPAVTRPPMQLSECRSCCLARQKARWKDFARRGGC